MKVFEQFNKAIMKKDLIEVDKEFFKKNNMSNIDYSYLENSFNKYKLNIENLYFYKNNFITNFIYLGEYIATEIFSLEKEVLENKSLGLNLIKQREVISQECYNNKEYIYLFNKEYNILNLYYFLKYYKKIDKKYLYETFLDCYQSISYGFEYINTEMFNYIMQYKKHNELDILNYLKHLEVVDNNATIEDYVEVFRGQGSKSLDLKKAKSWTLDFSIAEKFARYNNGDIIFAKVKIKDIIDYIDNGEMELLIDYDNIIISD